MNDLRTEIANKRFELIKSVDENGEERWSARVLMTELGYDRWENFENVINKAITACKKSGQDSMRHFREITKASQGGNGTVVMARDYDLSRYASYLVAQNGSSTKVEVALAQTYFAIQTRRQEVLQEEVKEMERLNAREKLTETEKKFSGIMFQQGVTGKGIATIRAKGDKVLFGGNSTEQMKSKLSVPKSRPLADFLPTVTIKAKDLATEMTTFKTKEKGLRSHDVIASTHESHNSSVRKALVNEGIYPEHLPKEEDIKKIERKIKREDKKKLREGFKIGS